MSKKTLSEFAWQVTPKRCKLMLALHEESPKRFTAFVVSFLQWFNEGAKHDEIEAATPTILKPVERADFENACIEHLDKFRDYHDGRDKSHANHETVTPQGASGKPPTKEEVEEICRTNAEGRDAAIYTERVWNDLQSYKFQDHKGKPITDYAAYITKCLFPMIDHFLEEQAQVEDELNHFKIGR